MTTNSQKRENGKRTGVSSCNRNLFTTFRFEEEPPVTFRHCGGGQLDLRDISAIWNPNLVGVGLGWIIWQFAGTYDVCIVEFFGNNSHKSIFSWIMKGSVDDMTRG